MENKINLALQVIPRSDEKDLYHLVDVAIEIIRESGLKYRVCPFETVLEGTYTEVMKVVEQARDACFAAGAYEILINIKMQIRKDEDVTMEEKTAKYD